MASNDPKPDSTTNNKAENEGDALQTQRMRYCYTKDACIRLQNPSDDARADVTAAVEELLNSLSNKFAGVSSEIFAKMDEMSRRLDNLEAALQENKSQDGGAAKPS
ncbi:Ff.00g126680.m01.CDS01 [Fusarium sp. VM40]|nr:Ff.00g126680.m01.CDS01 [Fusarium sp. VM40]